MSICQKCQSEMTFRSGVKKETGKAWAGNFCTNQDCKHVEWQRQETTRSPQTGGGYVLMEHFEKIINDLGERIAKLERKVFDGVEDKNLINRNIDTTEEQCIDPQEQ